MQQAHSGQRFHGAVSGLIATVPMTAIMLGSKYIFPEHAKKPVPPKEITGRILRRTGTANSLGPNTIEEATIVSHFGYGASAGSLYPSLRPYLPGGTMARGAAFGFGVWALGYAGYLPALGLQPDLEDQPRGRNIAMIAAHLVWGVALAALEEKLSRKTH